MWSPVGYLPFTSIDYQIIRIVSRAIPLKKLVRRDCDELEARLREFAWGDFVDRCPSLSVCSPSGLVLRVASAFGLRVREPLAEGGFATPWIYLNAAQGVIDTSGVLRRAKDARNFLSKHVLSADSDPSIPDTLTEYQFACLNIAAQSDKLIQAISNFDGWALCCREVDSPDSILCDFQLDYSDLSPEDFFDRMFEYPSAPGLGTSEVSVGRPPILENVSVAYKNCFPNGHTGKSWKEVRSALSEKGVACSVDTIRRALGLRN